MAERDNPLLHLFEEAPPALLPLRLDERLTGLAPTEQAAQWIEQLLADPRLDSIAGGRARAVQALLGFGHPFALRISPDELARYRATGTHRGRARRWARYVALLAAGPLGTWAGWLAATRGGGLPAVLFFLGSGAWALTVFGRAIAAWATLPRTVLRREVPAALFLSGVIALTGTADQAAPVLATLVPIAAGAALAAWLDR